MAPSKSLFLGRFIHSTSLNTLEYLDHCALCVDERGTIVAVERPCDLQRAEEVVLPRLGWGRGEVVVCTAGEEEFFFPGFIGLCS